MSSVNKAILVGNLGKDPEIRTTQDGREIASFSIACDEAWRDKQTGEKREKTEWINVVVFSQGLVSVVKNYVKKGSKLYVEGKIQTRKWQDKDGADRYSTEVVLQGYDASLVMLDGRKQESAPQESSAQYAAATGRDPAKYRDHQAPLEHDLDDDLPF